MQALIHSWKKKAAYLLSSSLVLCSIESSVIAFSKTDTNLSDSDSPKIVSERLDLREENVRAFQLDNGDIRCDIYATDIFFKDVDGTLKEIDNSIITMDGNDSFVYSNTANSWHAFFADNNENKATVKLVKDDYALSFYMLNSNNTSVKKAVDVLKPSNEIEKTLANDNRAVVYPNIYENVDITYTALSSALKEHIILRNREAESSFQFYMFTEGVELKEIDGQTVFSDETGNIVFSLAPLYMEDANGKYSDAISQTFTKIDNGYIITVSADRDFICADDTVFPVVIDPTYNTTGTNYTSDTFVANRSDRVNSNYYSDSYLRTGKDNTYGVRRTYIRFKLPSGYTNITSATLKLKSYSKGSGTSQLKVYKAGIYDTHYWRSNTLTWNNQPMSSGWSYISTASYSSGWYNANVLSYIQRIYTCNDYNIGFMIKDNNENNTSVWDTLYSSDAASGTPVLSITASSIWSTYDYESGNWPSGVSNHLTVHIDTDTVWTGFRNEISSGAMLWNGINSNVNIDSVTMSSGAGNGYRIRVKGNFLPSGTYAATGNYDSSNNVNWSGTWSYSIIDVPVSASHPTYLVHDDLQKQLFAHEVGHSLGLNDLYYTTCLMQSTPSYCYAMVTSHDKQTLNNKY